MIRRGVSLRRDTAWLFALLATFPVAATLACLATPGRTGRSRLGLLYPHPTGRMADAAGIFIANARVLALVAGATVLVAAAPAMTKPMTYLLTAVASLNVAIVSVSIASDGLHAASALLPHGPVELLAFSVAGAGFLHVRRHGTASCLRTVSTAFAIAVGLLAAAALLEVTPT